MSKEIISNSQQETVELGRALGRRLTKAAVIGLIGSLGAGKTEFVKGVAAGLGVAQIIQSPTFILMNVYPVRHASIRYLVHVDCYRIQEAYELTDIGVQDYLNDPAVVVAVEWADKIQPLLPRDAIMVSFDIIGTDERLIRMSGDPIV